MVPIAVWAEDNIGTGPVRDEPGMMRGFRRGRPPPAFPTDGLVQKRLNTLSEYPSMSSTGIPAMSRAWSYMIQAISAALPLSVE